MPIAFAGHYALRHSYQLNSSGGHSAAHPEYRVPTPPFKAAFEALTLSTSLDIGLLITTLLMRVHLRSPCALTAIETPALTSPIPTTASIILKRIAETEGFVTTVGIKVVVGCGWKSILKSPDQ